MQYCICIYLEFGHPFALGKQMEGKALHVPVEVVEQMSSRLSGNEWVANWAKFALAVQKWHRTAHGDVPSCLCLSGAFWANSWLVAVWWKGQLEEGHLMWPLKLASWEGSLQRFVGVGSQICRANDLVLLEQILVQQCPHAWCLRGLTATSSIMQGYLQTMGHTSSVFASNWFKWANLWSSSSSDLEIAFPFKLGRCFMCMKPLNILVSLILLLQVGKLWHRRWSHSSQLPECLTGVGNTMSCLSWGNNDVKWQ